MDRQLDEALKVLGIPAGSDRDTVNNAYRRLARVTHPDISSEPDAAERFATVAAAYRLVSASNRPAAHPRSVPASGSSESAPHRPAPPPPSVDNLRDLVGDWTTASYGNRPPIVAGPVVIRPARRGSGSGDA
jgi:curved DNA-binding protein CbpA